MFADGGSVMEIYRWQRLGEKVALCGLLHLLEDRML